MTLYWQITNRALDTFGLVGTEIGRSPKKRKTRFPKILLSIGTPKRPRWYRSSNLRLVAGGR